MRNDKGRGMHKSCRRKAESLTGLDLRFSYTIGIGIPYEYSLPAQLNLFF